MHSMKYLPAFLHTQRCIDIAELVGKNRLVLAVTVVSVQWTVLQSILFACLLARMFFLNISILCRLDCLYIRIFIYFLSCIWQKINKARIYGEELWEYMAIKCYGSSCCWKKWFIWLLGFYDDFVFFLFGLLYLSIWLYFVQKRHNVVLVLDERSKYYGFYVPLWLVRTSNFNL